MDGDKIVAIDNQLNNYVNTGAYLGGGISGKGGPSEYQHVAGFRDLAQTKPFTKETIVRLASSSKLLGTVAFLKLIDQGVITGQEPVANWIPAFANTKVIDPKIPTTVISLSNVLSATNGSNLVHVFQTNHGFNTGNTVGIQNATDVQGIPAAEINAVHVITVTDANNYTFSVSTNATGSSSAPEGGNIAVVPLEDGTLQRTFMGQYYYYKEIPLNAPIVIWHILTHTLGYQYYQVILGAPFGYAVGQNDPVKLYKSAIQASIMQEKLLPAAYPVGVLPLSSQDIKVWADTLATIPLLYQPGQEWTYGPVLSLLGALTEYIDGREFSVYFKEELTDPLNMQDTGFFIQDNDPDRADKLNRIADLPFVAAPGVFLPIGSVPGLGGLQDYFYGSAQPRKLALIDGGMFSTLKDMNKFYRMLLNQGCLKNNKLFVSPATVYSLSQNKIDDLSTYRLLDPSYQFRWGFGVATGAGSDTFFTLLGQSRRIIFWNGQLGTAFAVDFGNDSAVNLAVNRLTASTALPTEQPRIMNLHMTALRRIKVNLENADPTAPTPLTHS